VRYLQFTIQTLGTRSPAIAHFLLDIHAHQSSDDELMAYLTFVTPLTKYSNECDSKTESQKLLNSNSALRTLLHYHRYIPYVLYLELLGENERAAEAALSVGGEFATNRILTYKEVDLKRTYLHRIVRKMIMFDFFSFFLFHFSFSFFISRSSIAKGTYQVHFMFSNKKKCLIL
jgi:hypothetical protein